MRDGRRGREALATGDFFAVILDLGLSRSSLTALGVLPATAAGTRPLDTDRPACARLNPIDLERATVVKALERVHEDIREGRLGH